MSLFKKPKKNLSLKSSRAVDDDTEAESASASATNVIEKPPVIEITKPGSNSVISTISFAEESEEKSEFRVKKPDRSVKVAKQYKQEFVKAQKKTEKVGRNIAVAQNSESKAFEKIQISEEEDVVLTGEDAVVADAPDSSSDQPVSFNASLQEMLKSGVLPDANMIHLIRKKRMLMRDTGVATGTATTGDVGAPLRVEPRREDKSALVREDDEADRSDVSDQEGNDGDDSRLKMSVRQRQEDKRQQLRNEFITAEQGSDEESDQEREWEKQQISKGVSTLAVAEQQAVVRLSINEYEININRPATSGSHRAPTMLSTTPKATVGEICNELSQHLSDLVDSNRRHKFERQARTDSYEYSLEEIKRAESEAAAVDSKYRFYQELMAYVLDFIDCYNTKMPAINSLEEKLINLYQQRADRLMKRRRQDVVDQSLESAAPKPGQPAYRPDEENKARIADRNNRRSRRRWKRQEQGVRNHYDGWSTDDEECTSDNIKLGTERSAFRKQVGEVVSEICEDFVLLDAVISRFDGWRNKYPDTYQSAFGGLCLSKLVAPLVRLQIFDWNPLEENATCIQNQSWFKTLASYCRIPPEDGTKSISASLAEDELSILPSVVDRVIILKISAFVSKVWDPLSLSQTIRLATLLESLAEIFPTLNTNSKQLRELLLAVKIRFNDVLGKDIFTPMCSKQGLADRTSPSAQFFYRQLWTCVKLFVSMSRFSNLLAPSTLQELMLTGLLNRYVALGLTQLDIVNQEVIELYTTIMTAVPRIWFADIPASQTSTTAGLKTFSTLLFQFLAKFSLTASSDASASAAVSVLASAVSDFFLAIHALDLASRIVSELQIQLPS